MLKAAATSRDGDEIRPVIGRTYERLHPIQTPFPLHYGSVVVPLLDVLQHIYKKLLDPACGAPILFECIRNLDRKLQTLVIQHAVRDVHVIGARTVNQAMASLAVAVQCQTAFSVSGPVPSQYPPATAAHADDEFILVDD